MYPLRTAGPWVEAGHEFGLVARAQSPLAKAFGRDHPELPLFEVSPGLWNGFGAKSLRKAIQSFRPHALHAHKGKDLGPLALARGSASPPILFTEQMGGRRPKKDPYHRWVYGQVARVLSISQEVLERNRRTLPIPPEKASLLYYGLDLTRFDPEPHRPRRVELRKEFGLPAHQLLLGISGRISQGKGHRLLLEAFAKIASRVPNLDLVLIGDGTGRYGGEPEIQADLEAFRSSQGLGERVHFTGFTPRVPEVLSTLDLAAVCSESEAFGLTAIECMAMGLPLIASRSGALPEIVAPGVHGALYEPQDPQSLAEAIRGLLEDPAELSQLGTQGRASVCSRFSMERHITNLEEVYRAAQAGRAPALSVELLSPAGTS